MKWGTAWFKYSQYGQIETKTFGKKINIYAHGRTHQIRALNMHNDHSMTGHIYERKYHVHPEYFTNTLASRMKEGGYFMNSLKLGICGIHTNYEYSISGIYQLHVKSRDTVIIQWQGTLIRGNTACIYKDKDLYTNIGTQNLIQKSLTMELLFCTSHWFFDLLPSEDPACQLQFLLSITH